MTKRAGGKSVQRTPRVPIKVLWHSNSPWASTGYGQQTAIFTPRLARIVDSLAISAFYGVHGGIVPWNGIPVLPPAFDAYGNDTIQPHAEAAFKGMDKGLVITLCDVWVLDAKKFAALKTASWVPIDHEPAQPPTVTWLNATNAVPIAMSRFGERMLRDEGLDPVYVPHGYDPAVMFQRDRAKAKEMLGVSPDQFLVGMVAANISRPSRKSYPEAFLAFAELARRHPEAVLYVHAHPFDKRGFHLPDMAKHAGIPTKQVRFADPYTYNLTPSPDVLAHAYSAMDVLLAPSAGEGFGIPVLEAQACGTPVIVSDFSAQPELCGAGWKVAGQKAYTGLRSWQIVPYIDDIADKLERAFAEATGMREQAAEWAKPYDADRVFAEHFLPALQVVRERTGL